MKMPPAVDLCTEVGQARKVRSGTRSFPRHAHNLLFLNDVILFKYCTETGMPLPGGHLGGFPGAYSQSYPQNLWVSHFLFCSNQLRAYAKIFSSICRQAFDPA